jgi:hypothetical protein
VSYNVPLKPHPLRNTSSTADEEIAEMTGPAKTSPLSCRVVCVVFCRVAVPMDQDPIFFLSVIHR